MEKNNTSPDLNRLGRIGNRPIWVLYLSIIVRTIHQLSAGVFVGLYILISPASSYVYLKASMFSGGMLFLTESLRHRQMYKELTGLVTLTKLGILGLAFHGVVTNNIYLIIIFVIASISSHAPRNIRHRIFF